MVFDTRAERGNYTIGYGTGTTHEAPVNNAYRYSFTEIIYGASEINSRPGWIESISFKYAYDVIMTEKGEVTIYLANTTKEVFESAEDWVIEDLTMVYRGTLNCHEGWNTFEFERGFLYTGNNLLVVVDDNSGSYDGQSYRFYFSDSWGDRVIRTESDGRHWTVEGEDAVTGREGRLSGARPNVQFCIDVTCSFLNMPHVEIEEVDGGCPLAEGEDYVVTSTVTEGTPIYSYYWSGDYVGNGAYAAIRSNGVCRAYALRLVVIDAMGCTDTAWREFVTMDVEAPWFNHPEIFTADAIPIGEGCLYELPDLAALLGPEDNCDIDTIYQEPGAGDTIWCDTNAVVTVRDGCGNESERTVRVVVPEGLTASLDHRNAVCKGTTYGTISVHDIEGGTGEYSIRWQMAEGDSLRTLTTTEGTIENCEIGSYWVTVTDANGCWIRLHDSVWADYDIRTEIYPHDVSCYGTRTGYIVTDEVEGGLAPYRYAWSNGGRDSNAYDLMPGEYTLTITDENGCWLDTTVTIHDREELIMDTLGEITHNLCHGYHSGAFAVTAAGGVPPYGYTVLEESNNTGSFSNLYAGNYHVTVTDSLGCTDTLEIEITEPEGLEWVFDITGLTCYNDNSGAVEVRLSGATTPYSYRWNTGEVSTTLMNLAAGDYSLHVSDGNGCEYDTTIYVAQPDPFRISVTDNLYICNGETVTLSASASGGTAPYTFVWEGDVVDEDYGVTPQKTTTYHVVGTDDNGCADSTETTVTVKEPTWSVDEERGCDRYTWPLNGVTYTESTNTEQVVYTGGNSVGCDSTVTLHLEIYPSSIIVDTVLPVCINRLPLRVGENEYSEPGTYHTMLSTTEGCDSALTFTLVIRDTNVAYDTDSIAENQLPWTYSNRIYPTPIENDIFVLPNRWGCDSTIHYTLFVYWECSEFLQFPSVVTANGDGINDIFYIYGLLEEDCWPENRLTVYNQWGTIVFKAENMYSESDFWDPAESRTPAGTYFYVFRGQGFKGKTQRRGSVEVLR